MTLVALTLLVATSREPLLEVAYCDRHLNYFAVVGKDNNTVLVHARIGPLDRHNPIVPMIKVVTVPAHEATDLRKRMTEQPISWNPSDYAVPDSAHTPSCGFVRQKGKTIALCGITRSPPLHNAASVRVDELVAHLQSLSNGPVTPNTVEFGRTVLVAALKGLASERSLDPSPRQADHALQSLASCAAAGLVWGELINDPLKSAMGLVRLAGVSFVARELPDSAAEKALSTVLNDQLPKVRAAAASELASHVRLDNKEVVSKLEQVSCELLPEDPFNVRLREILSARGLSVECAPDAK